MRRTAVRLRMTARALVLGLTVAGAAAVAPVLALPVAAADQAVTAAGGLCNPPVSSVWQNANPTINVGDTVTWKNCTTGQQNHSLESYSSGWCLPFGQIAGARGSNWSYSCKFASAGSYSYWCGVHGSSMSGLITVLASAPPPPPPAPTHSQAPPPAPPPTHAPQGPVPTPVPAAPSPSPSPSPEAVVPSPSPSPSPSGSAATVLASAPTSSGGSGSPLPAIVAVGVIAVLGGGAFYWFRFRQPL